jgi:GDP-mannose transporter
MRKKIKATGFSDWDSMFYNNLLSIPVLLLFSLVIENWGSDNLEQSLYVNFVPPPSAMAYYSRVPRCRYSPRETRGLLLFAIAFSGAAAVGISYTTAWCIRVTSSTTYR